MKDLAFGCTIPLGSLDTILDYAMLAEKYNFDVIWFPNHMVTTDPNTICLDTWSVMSIIGSRTQRIKLADGVSDPIRRHPSMLAQTVATVDQATKGRVILGMGAGENMNLKPFGMSRPDKASERREMLKEAIHVIRKLWEASAESPATYEGRYFKLKNAFLGVKPKREWPPIYIGAMGPKTRELVGEIADGYYPLVITAELFPKFLEDIKKGLEKSGRKLDEIDCAARVFAAVADDPEKARNLVVDRAKRHLILDGGVALKSMGYDIQIEGNISSMLSGQKTVEYIEKLKSSVPEKAAESISIFGTIEDCIKQVERFMNVGVTQLIVFTTSRETIVKFGEVIKYFRELNR